LISRNRNVTKGTRRELKQIQRTRREKKSPFEFLKRLDRKDEAEVGIEAEFGAKLKAEVGVLGWR
jgi:transposase